MSSAKFKQRRANLREPKPAITDWDEGPNSLETPSVRRYIDLIEDMVIAAGKLRLSEIIGVLQCENSYLENVNILDLPFSCIQQNLLTYRLEWEPKVFTLEHTIDFSSSHKTGTKRVYAKERKRPARRSSNNTSSENPSLPLSE